MAFIVDAFKILIVPAFIAGVIYVLLAYLIVPLLRRHRERYNQYVPLDSIMDTTSAVRSRIVSSTIDFLLRVFERRRRSIHTADIDEEDDTPFGDEEGDTMVGFEHSRHTRSTRNGDVGVYGHTRQQRDLEDGFTDEVDESPVDDRARGHQR